MSLINNPKLLKLISFVAIAFPGGYRFLCVIAITNLFSIQLAEHFSKGFFWVILITTFSGIPIAAVMSNRVKQLTLMQMYLSVIVSSSIFTVACYFITFKSEGFTFFIEVYIATLCLSLFEVNRKLFFNEGRYVETFICACISIVSFSLILFFSEKYILITTFMALFIPIGIFSALKYRKPKILIIENTALLLNYRNFLLSNAFSTSLNSLIPILLIFMIGDEIAPQMAQVFSLSSLLLLVPRVISVRNIPRLRKEGPRSVIVLPFYSLMKKYVLFLGGITIIGFYLFFGSPNWLLLWLLLFSTQLSQLCLPYSNALTVEARSSTLLKINFQGTLFFVFFASIATEVFPKETAIAFIVVFGCHQLFKLFITKRVCESFLR
jgi:hypothetical protein